MILAIDPGTHESGWVHLDNGKIWRSGVSANEDIFHHLRQQHVELVAIEMIASYGMPVGKEVFETCVWIGRFIQYRIDGTHEEDTPIRLIYRKDVKMHLCGSPRAKDGNIRQALIDLLGPQGTKKTPGPTYGIKSHAWAALGVAVTAAAGMTGLTA